LPNKVWSFEADLARAVVDIITVFSARLYGWRSPENRTLLDDIAKAVETA
jgi:putative resolvase